MLLIEKLVVQGNRLFNRRGTYASILGIPVLWMVFQQDPAIVGWVGKTACLVVSLAGLAIRAYTVGCRATRTSGRNTHKGQVADALNTTGIYSMTRNPLYLANFLIALGVVMFFFLWWLVVIYILAFWLFYERIILAEEDFLHGKFGEAYLEWAEKTPAFFPSIRNRIRPEHSFSWKIALKSEYQTLTSTLLAFTVLQIIGLVRQGHQIGSVLIWVFLLVLTLVFFLGVRHLHKNTLLLKVPER